MVTAKVDKHLQQEGLELVVGAVDLVDEQHGVGRAQRLQDRPLQQETLVEQRLLQALGVKIILGRGLDRPDVQDLAGEVPVVERLARLDPLVALQPDQLRAGDLAHASASDVLPVPGSPSSSSGRFIAVARKMTVDNPSLGR